MFGTTFFADNSASTVASQGGIDSFTKLMLHMDGTNGGTTFTDSSLTPKTMTAHGGAITSTAQSVFGGSSGLFVKATTSYIDTPNSTDFDPGAGDFTVDFRIYINSQSSLFSFFGKWTTAGSLDYVPVLSGGVVTFFYTVDGSNILAPTFAWAPSNSTWYHVAFVRSGNNLNLYVNGVATGGTVDFTGVTIASVSNPFVIGANSTGSNPADAYFDEFRLSKGIARWTANFTPPAAPYTT